MKDLKWTKVALEKAPTLTKDHTLLANYMASMKRGNYTQTAFVKVFADPTAIPVQLWRQVQFGSETDIEWHSALLTIVITAPVGEKKS